MSGLVIVPTYLRTPQDLTVTVETLDSVRETEPQIETLVVDDCSPVEGLVDELETHCQRLDVMITRQPENAGFSRTVNVGLKQALARGMDAILMNADIHCMTKGWYQKMHDQPDTQGRPAHVVGPLLLYANGLIQQAGIYFSMLTRAFDHRYRFGPGDLPEALMPYCCPVTGAFQFIRHECLVEVGLYDEAFRMAYEDVDYCLRVTEAGQECIYQPSILAIHHESLFRGRADQKLTDWQQQSLQTLMRKHAKTNMAQWIPPML